VTGRDVNLQTKK